MEHARMVAWSGRSWTVKASRTPVGPGPNLFSDSIDNVWVDPVGRLHLKITSRRGRWHAAEVVLGHSLGHGTYRFVLASRLDRFDPNVVAGLFTWSDEPASHHREIDIEFGRWSDAPQCNARYTVQPFDAAGHGPRSGRPLRPRPAMSSDGRRTACHSAVPVRPARPSPTGTIAVPTFLRPGTSAHGSTCGCTEALLRQTALRSSWCSMRSSSPG